MEVLLKVRLCCSNHSRDGIESNDREIGPLGSGEIKSKTGSTASSMWSVKGAGDGDGGGGGGGRDGKGDGGGGEGEGGGGEGGGGEGIGGEA